MREVTACMHFFQVISMDKLKKLIQANEGFTLVELLLAIGILGIFMTMIIPMIIQPFNIVVPSSQRMSAKQMAELHVTEISRYVRNGEKDKINYDEDNNIINISDNGITRSFNNITHFNINKDDDNYKITLEKLEKKEKGKVTTIVNSRNIQDEGGNDNDNNNDDDDENNENENGEPTTIEFVSVPNTILDGEIAQIKVSIKDNNNSGIPGEVVDFEIDNNGIPARTSINLNIDNDITDDSGKAKAVLELDAHKHDKNETFIIKASHENGLYTEHIIEIQ